MNVYHNAWFKNHKPYVLLLNCPKILYSMKQNPCSRVLLEKLTGLQLVKKLPVFYGTWRFIITITSVCHLTLYSARSSPYPTSHFHKIHLNIIFHLHLGIPSGPLPSGFPTKTLNTPLLSPILAACPTNLVLLAPKYHTIFYQGMKMSKIYNL